MGRFLYFVRGCFPYYCHFYECHERTESSLASWRSPLLSWWTIYESTSPIPAAIVAWRLLRSTLQRLASPLCNCVRTHTHTKLQLLLLLCFYPACSCFPVFWLLLPESKDSKDQKAKGKCSVFPLFPESTPSPNGLLCLVASSEAIRTLPKQF